MSDVLVDSDILSFFFKGNPQVVENVRLHLKKRPDLRISVLSYYEIRRGLEALGSAARIKAFDRWAAMTRVIPLDTPVAEVASRLHASLKTKGSPIGEADLLIAATALHHGWDLATNNERHFQRIPYLKLRNWTRPQI